MLSVFDELNVLIEKVISVCYYSFITIPYFWDFSKYDVYGEVAKVLSVFAVVFVMIIVLHFIMLTLQYTVAGTLSKRNPFFL